MKPYRPHWDWYRSLPPDVCFFCGREETIGHIFLRCQQHVTEIWRDLKVRCGFAVKQHTFFRTHKQWLFDRLME
jgi:hypothetical protein